LENTARRLEFFEKENWPDNALDLAEVMYTAFSNVSQSTQDRGVATPMQFATKVSHLQEELAHFRSLFRSFIEPIYIPQWAKSAKKQFERVRFC